MKEEKRTYLDKFRIIDDQLRHIVERIETFGSFVKVDCGFGENDFINEAIYPFAKNLKMIANQSLNRLQKLGDENTEKILGLPNPKASRLHVGKKSTGERRKFKI